jgi:hypothetical protein
MITSQSVAPGKSLPQAGERRITGIALRYWYGLRGARDCPAQGELEPTRPHELAPHLFIVTPGAAAESYRILEAGDALATLCRSDPVGRAVNDSLPRLMRERAQAVIWTAMKIRKPLADCGHFCETRDTDMFYRSVYMPLADRNGRLEGLLGAISFKREAALAA